MVIVLGMGLVVVTEMEAEMVEATEKEEAMEVEAVKVEEAVLAELVELVELVELEDQDLTGTVPGTDQVVVMAMEVVEEEGVVVVEVEEAVVEVAGMGRLEVLEVLEALVDKDGLGLSQDASGMVQGPVRGRGGGAGRMEKATKGKERQ